MIRGEAITVRGQVQGVGFRPTVWRIATELGLTGDVRNTGEGVEIQIWGRGLERFAERLRAEMPLLARIDTLERRPLAPPAVEAAAPHAFAIVDSDSSPVQTSVTPDAASCAACIDEALDPFARRYRYPFTNCTHCGPRFSIVRGIPYDRDQTTMAAFAICPDCVAEYKDPGNRRFHAQPIACHRCGPRAWVEKLGLGAVSYDAFSMLDDVDAAGGMLMNGHIVAIKGLGGFHLACDATNAAVVERLRLGKRRHSKAFALMARDLEVIWRYCHLSAAEEALLTSPQAPIVLLAANGNTLPDAVAPGLNRLGFMLPHTPLHHLLLRRMDRPVVMTSGNISGHPQCTTNIQVREALHDVADFALMHDRDIANRLDDSVVRVDLGQARMIRRARGYAPAQLPLPPGFAAGRQVLALGAALKNTFCLSQGNSLILSQHMGDLENAAAALEVEHNLALYQELYAHQPDAIAVDQHSDYLSSKNGKALARDRDLQLLEVQHHHAHIAACLAENQRPLSAGPVLGIALDGLGLGADGTLWGGEFLSVDYTGFQRLGCFKPVPLIGGSAAMREPWRNAYAHLMAEMGWAELSMNFDALPLYARMSAKPRATLDAMLAKQLNTPLCSSCGRLFDAAAAICGLAWESQSYEGEAAMLLEAAIDENAMQEADDLAYPFTMPLLGGKGLPYIEPIAVWRAMLGDLHLGTPVGVIAARFHRGLAKAVVALARRLAQQQQISTVALSGGCFQNATLFTLVHQGLEAAGLEVLSHTKVPANDGGLALGQAVIALARLQQQQSEGALCA